MKKTGWFEGEIDRLFTYGVFLPQTVTMKSKSKFIRLLGIPWFLLWFIPSGLVCFPIFAILLTGMIFEMAWKGEDY